jgi:nitrogen fixation NifU-like protein
VTASAADLYDESIKATARRAVGAGQLEQPDVEVTIDNPLCGDRVTLGIKSVDGRISEVGHRVRGCLLCEAAASLIAESAIGATSEQITTATVQVEELLAGRVAHFEPAWQACDMFAPVREFKSRHRCVTLPFEALREALEGLPERPST